MRESLSRLALRATTTSMARMDGASDCAHHGRAHLEDEGADKSVEAVLIIH
jgi:hypothetical protein